MAGGAQQIGLHPIGQQRVYMAGRQHAGKQGSGGVDLLLGWREAFRVSEGPGRRPTCHVDQRHGLGQPRLGGLLGHLFPQVDVAGPARLLGGLGRPAQRAQHASAQVQGGGQAVIVDVTGRLAGGHRIEQRQGLGGLAVEQQRHRQALLHPVHQGGGQSGRLAGRLGGGRTSGQTSGRTGRPLDDAQRLRGQRLGQRGAAGVQVGRDQQ